MDIKHTAFPGWPLSGSGGDRPLLAGLSQGGVQVGRRKPVIQGGPAREILSESPSAGCGRSCEVTNGSFVAAKLTEGPRASAAASGKSGCPVRVGSSSWQDGEAAVRRLPTLERQVTGTLLPDCAIKPRAVEAEDEAVSLKRPLAA